MKTSVRINIDIDDVFDELNEIQKEDFIGEHISYACLSDLVDELEKRGYEVWESA